MWENTYTHNLRSTYTQWFRHTRNLVYIYIYVCIHTCTHTNDSHLHTHAHTHNVKVERRLERRWLAGGGGEGKGNEYVLIQSSERPWPLTHWFHSRTSTPRECSEVQLRFIVRASFLGWSKIWIVPVSLCGHVGTTFFYWDDLPFYFSTIYLDHFQTFRKCGRITRKTPAHAPLSLGVGGLFCLTLSHQLRLK